MNLMRSSASMAVAATLVFGLLPQVAAATEVTGKENLVCATRHVMACMDEANCMRGSAKTFDVPAFMFVDLKTNQLRGVDDDGSTVASTSQGKDITPLAVILQGFENHTGWTVAIDRANGDFTLSLTSAEISFMIMGSCTTN
jgi:hypothetical protein